MSFPFYNKLFDFSQPDGSRIKVRGWGDQNHAVFESLDGYTVMVDPDSGTYCYANLSDDQEDYISTGVQVDKTDPSLLNLRKGLRVKRSSVKQKAMAAYHVMGSGRRCEQRRRRSLQFIRQQVSGNGPVMAPPSRETIGTYKGLCLLIQFPDMPGTIQQSDVDAFCNQPGYTGFQNNGSVYDYFKDNSGGKVDYTNIVLPYYTAKKERSYYASKYVQHGIRARELVKEALTHFKNQGFDFSQLTVDDEDYAYAVNIFYSGSVPNGWGEGLWPHSWCLALPFNLSPGINAYDYQITDMGSELSLATFCHENGHMICDYPDLYDYGYESRGVGEYCLMCGGGQNEKNPTNICAYLKYKSGWIDKLNRISGPMEAEITSDQNDFHIYARNMQEYFIIENRQQRNRDEFLPSSGLAIWHVDELGSNNDEHMDSQRHYECSLEQADNEFDLEMGSNTGDSTDLFHTGTNSRFSDTTEPNSLWWDGTPSGLVLSDIGPSKQQMTFRTGFYEEEQTETYGETSIPHVDIPDYNHDGIYETITLSATAKLSTLTVSVDITHTYIGDLKVTLFSPEGTPVILHNRAGGRTDNLFKSFDFSTTPELRNLIHQSIQGEWTLWVQDLASRDSGVLNQWEIVLEASESPVLELDELPETDIPDHDINGIKRVLNATGGGTVKTIEVSIDITHTYIGDLTVSLTSPSGKKLMLHNRTGRGTDNLIQTYAQSTLPELGMFVQEPIDGDWQLHVADCAGLDKGKLNWWAFKITR